MTDKPSRPSLRKGDGANAQQPGAAAGASPADAKPTGPKPPVPKQVMLAFGALVLSGIAALGAALSLFGLKGWLRGNQRDSLNSSIDDKFDDLKKAAGSGKSTQLDDLRTKLDGLKNTATANLSGSKIDSIRDQVKTNFPSPKKASDAAGDLRDRLHSLTDISHQVDLTVKSQLIATIVVFVALTMVGLAARAGRYWARWGVIGLWVLATFTGTLAGLGSVISVGGDSPAGFKIPAFLAGLLFVAAVVLVNLRPSTEFFNHNRPERPAGAPQRRGLFAPREPLPPRGQRAGTARTAGRAAERPGSGSARRTATTRPADADAGAKSSTDANRPKAKQRADPPASDPRAAAARNRARAGKSRRTGV